MTKENINTVEEWRPVVGLEDAYEISSLGAIRNINPKTRQRSYFNRVLNQKIDKYGYPAVTLKRSNVKYHRTIHRLVAEAFLGVRPEGFQVNHKDGNKKNNGAENLEYMTSGENVRHASRIGLLPTGDNHWTRRHPEWLKRKNGKWCT